MELKPHILNVEILEIKPSKENDYLYDITLGIKYEGSHYLHTYVEEEYSSLEATYFSDVPYYTQLTLKEVDTYGYVFVHFITRNNYGNDEFVLEIPSESLDSYNFSKSNNENSNTFTFKNILNFINKKNIYKKIKNK